MKDRWINIGVDIIDMSITWGCSVDDKLLNNSQTMMDQVDNVHVSIYC